MDCRKCGAHLTTDEKAIYMKLVSRNASSFLCMDCLAEALHCERKAIEERIRYYRESGNCVLFREAKPLFTVNSIIPVKRAFVFSRATSQNSCLHENFATDTISSRIREVYFISFMQVRSKVLLWGSPILCLLTVIQQLFYNADRKDRKKETAWNGQR